MTVFFRVTGGYALAATVLSVRLRIGVPLHMIQTSFPDREDQRFLIEFALGGLFLPLVVFWGGSQAGPVWWDGGTGGFLSRPDEGNPHFLF